VLDKETCKKCWKAKMRDHRVWAPGQLTFTSTDELLWKDYQEAYCAEHPISGTVKVDAPPPIYCPYKLEHAVSETVSACSRGEH
jgi:hypothetical protein